MSASLAHMQNEPPPPKPSKKDGCIVSIGQIALALAAGALLLLL